MKKIVSLIFVLLLIVTAAFPAGAAFDSGTVTSNLKSKIYYMQSLDGDTVFFEKNSEKKTAPAGFVKLITAVVAIEKWNNLDEMVTVTKENLSLVEYTYGVRTASYKPGEQVSKRELIDALIVYSANDAASIIAYEISGSVEKFLVEVKSTLDKIGCSSTVIKNIHGFDEDGQVTTAKDVAKLIKHAYEYPAFKEAFSADSVMLKKTNLNDAREVKASNKMKNSAIPDYYHSSVTAGKQTSTEKAGECIAVISYLDGYSYITVVMNGSLQDIDSDTVNENTCMTDARQMLRWVYKNIKYREVVVENQVIATVDVVAGKKTDEVKLVPAKVVYALVPANVTPGSVLIELVDGTVPEKLKAPLKAGDSVGQAKVYYANVALATVDLVIGEDVKMSIPGLIWSFIRSILTSTVFIVILILAVLGSAAYVGYLYYLYKKHEKQERERKEKLQQRRKEMAKNVKK